MATPSERLVANRVAFQAALLDWYREQRRRLPWREAPSLYKTVVSEFMLQQTQVKTVLPYFARWLDALPDFAALAAASEERVLKLWEGLGYYSRARNLHKLARAVAALPTPPRDPAAWREFPGVGPYTAAAITSISFGASAACVDGNVVRILARLTADDTRFRDSASAAKALAPLAEALLSPAHPGDHNQAMMELGATVCTRHNPLCTLCPVRTFCAAARTGDPEAFPTLAARKIEQLAVTRVWCVDQGRLLLHRAAAGARRLSNLLELPDAATLDLQPGPQTLIAVKRRAITRFQITESIHAVTPDGALLRRISGDATLEWVAWDALEKVTLSGPHKRWIGELRVRHG